MYTCDRSTKKGKEICEKIDKYVAHLGRSKEGYQPGSRDYRAASIIIKYVGSKGDGKGPNYVPGSLKFAKVAQTNQRGTTTMDLSKPESDDMVASEMGHEAQHDLDVRDRGGPYGNTSDRNTAEAEFREAEKNGYKAQSVILGGFGKTLTSNDLRRGIEGSVKGDMAGWDEAHKQPGSK